MPTPTRIPDAKSIASVLDGLAANTADVDLAPALSRAFPGFDFSVVRLGDEYWRDVRFVLSADGSRLGELRPWMTAELNKDGGDIKATWSRLKDSDLKLTEWHGETAFAFASTGPGAADFIQVSLGREIEWLAGPIVDPRWPPFGEEELFDPGWIPHGRFTEHDELAGPLYRLRRGAEGLVHMRSFLGRRARLEREKRERRRPELERKVVVETGPLGHQETPYLDMFPGYFDFVPREIRFFQDWEDSTARDCRVFDCWAFDIRDYEHRGERELSFNTRPLKQPSERLLAEDAGSVHQLMDRIERIDAQIGFPFAWFFLMSHGHWVERDVGEAIAAGLRQERIRLPEENAKVLLRWADATYGF